jgi:S-methylmethionine-dependent homocysteine/selenocysteine methylase
MELIGRARATTAKPIVVYPNNGQAWDAAARQWVGTTVGTVDGVAARRWVVAGASLVGGCCRVGPDGIADMARALAVGWAEAGDTD